MGKKKRHHYIPRLLLKRFASRSTGKKSWVWQMASDVPPKEISVRDAAVGKMFYGDTGVEDALNEVESRVSRALLSIDAGGNLQQHNDELRWLVYMLSVRTRALREHTIDAVQRVARTTGESASPGRVRAYLTKEAATSFNEMMDDALSDMTAKLSPKERRIAKAVMRDPKKKASMRRGLLGHDVANTGSEFVRAQFGVAANRPVLQRAMKDGQIRGLASLLDSSLVPAWFAPATWEVVEFAGDSLFLGDCCVVAIGRDGVRGLLFRHGADWSVVFAPLSPSRLLVGLRDASAGTPDHAVANDAAASLSHSYLYTHDCSGAGQSCAPLVGTADALMSDGEIDRFPDELWDDLLGGSEGADV